MSLCSGRVLYNLCCSIYSLTSLFPHVCDRSEVKERVVWVDTKKTQVENKAGKLKEKEITVLEVLENCYFRELAGGGRLMLSGKMKNVS